MITSSGSPLLMLVSDRQRARLPLPLLASRAIAGGVDLVQIREKDLSEPALHQLVREVLAEVDQPERIVVNGSLSIAREFGISVHLPEQGASVCEARDLLGSTRLIGRSVHSIQAVIQSDAADYLVAGHVFATTSKPGKPPIELAGLTSFVDASPIPVIAIGGISSENVTAVLETGVRGVAVISAINNADDPEQAAAEIRQTIDRWRVNVSQDRQTHADVTINGKSVSLDQGTTVSQFLATKGLQERLVVVELNESILARDLYASTVLAAGDHVEIVHFVGGG